MQANQIYLKFCTNFHQLNFQMFIFYDNFYGFEVDVNYLIQKQLHISQIKIQKSYFQKILISQKQLKRCANLRELQNGIASNIFSTIKNSIKIWIQRYQKPFCSKICHYWAYINKDYKQNIHATNNDYIYKQERIILIKIFQLAFVDYQMHIYLVQIDRQVDRYENDWFVNSQVH
ncbi:hypothetical protein TTHERM_000455537 (macronuclear) [Tetrahymena thermophila SB210]|uniref:Uncharacterized protein n=1 Tax=Tetrahymena thermophila (strain SB210) TaxID=312017 RepID=W7WYK7_TETTS|nr:hypothetical protein TTHERM_000455537 [Tetrahymena thermophila SB210]EWS71970.1 hypothetical protein TTHERM_000455537 [Tetrahymena thermophila SB210]|eukprot:XP_012655470.1 hypothetical protein TTHERM_000455537 [Tetrahymena thermophila SB210]